MQIKFPRENFHHSNAGSSLLLSGLVLSRGMSTIASRRGRRIQVDSSPSSLCSRSSERVGYVDILDIDVDIDSLSEVFVIVVVSSSF